MGVLRKLFTIILFLGLGVFTMTLIFHTVSNTRSKTYVSPLSTTLPTPSIQSARTSQNHLTPLIEKSLEGTKGSYAVAVKNLKTGETAEINAHKKFDTGSLYKLWIMAVVYQQIERGELQPDDVLEEDVTVLNDKFDIASEAAELTEGTVTFTVSQALEQMITISHNYAALLLTEKVKLSTVKMFLTSNGFTESTVGVNGDLPTSTASDIALFYEKLYNGDLAGKDSTDQMIELLKRQKLNNKLPKYLPDEAVVAHKTGEIDEYTHDGGIIYGEVGDYIMVMLSKSDFPEGAEERIANTSKDVYDYFLKGGDNNEES